MISLKSQIIARNKCKVLLMANPFMQFAFGANKLSAENSSKSDKSLASISKKRKLSACTDDNVKDKIINIHYEEEELNEVFNNTSDTSIINANTHINNNHSNDRNLWLLDTMIESRKSMVTHIDKFGTHACIFKPIPFSTDSVVKLSIDKQLQGTLISEQAEGIAEEVDGVPSFVQRFQILIAGMLSTQTHDHITYEAMQRLHQYANTYFVDNFEKQLESTSRSADQYLIGFTLEDLKRISVTELDTLLNPVGFHHRKAQQLKQIGNILRYDIPNTYDKLLSLPGIGPKVARVILLLAWDTSEYGIIVDTHIYRLAHRLQWIATSRKVTETNTTLTADDVRQDLEEWVPHHYWKQFSQVVVGFGQSICKSINPGCGSCPLRTKCPSAFKCPKKRTTKKKAR